MAIATGTAALAYPLLRSAARADVLESDIWAREGPEPRAERRLAGTPAPAGLRRRPADRTPSLVKSGYLRIVPDRLAAHLRAMLDAGEAQILARDPSDRGGLIVVATSGGDPELVGGRLAADRGVAAMALASGQPVAVPGTHGGESELSAAAAPVASDGRVAGVVLVTARDAAHAFELQDLELLCEVSELAGGALERPAEREMLERTADAQAASLATAVELWDRTAGAHSADVVALAGKCGRRMGLSSSEQLELELAARLHDVGKIRVPRELLERPVRLSADEFRIMQLHSIWGAELVARVPGLAAVALVVRHHHERMDGSGYPAGLSGERIPLAARIVAAADAYATMTQGRPYRVSIPPANAIEELRVHAGEQFDPDVVEALSESVGAHPAVVPLALPARA